MEWFVFALGSAILTALAAVLTKRTLFEEHASEFSTSLAITNVVVSIPLILWVQISLPLFVWFVIIFSAFMAAVGFLLTAKALRHMEISIVSPFRNFNPAIIAVLAVILLGEKLNLIHIAGILTLVIGSYILEIDFRKDDLLTPFKKIRDSKYIHFLFVSLVAYAFSSIGGKYALNFVSPITLVFLTQFFVAILFLIFFSTEYDDGISGIKHGLKKSGSFILLVSLLTVSYRLLQSQAMSMKYVSLVIPIKGMSTLFSTIIGGKLFREEGLLHKIAACIIMILGASMIILG